MIRNYTGDGRKVCICHKVFKGQLLAALFGYTGKSAFLCNQITFLEDVYDVHRKAALQLHIGTGSGASPVGIEKFREFEADLSALFYTGK